MVSQDSTENRGTGHPLSEQSGMRQPLNFLYLLGPLALSNWNNQELRYSLRSISSLAGWVGITGPECPSWLRGVEHINVELLAGISRYKNMQRQLIAACESPLVPEDLILMNDDFIIRSTPEWDWTPTFLGPIVGQVDKGGTWKRTVVATGEWLKKNAGIAQPLSYEGHTPMPFKKSLALPVLYTCLAAETPLQFRSMYGNLVGIGGRQHPNAKRRDPAKWPSDSPFWSLRSTVEPNAKAFLEKMLPDRSRWEVEV